MFRPVKVTTFHLVIERLDQRMFGIHFENLCHTFEIGIMHAHHPFHLRVHAILVGHQPGQACLKVR